MNGGFMLKKLYYPLFLGLLLSNQLAFAQLPDFTTLVEQSGAAVVNVSRVQKEKEPDQMQGNPQMPEGAPPELEEFFRHFFRGQPGFGGRNFVPRESKSLGSGFIISSDGYVLTNHHVVKDADEIIVKLSDRRELEAKLVGSDPRTDVALLKLDANNLPVVKIGAAERLKVGEWVLAIGTPFGFEQSVTAGIVSAKGRSLPGDNYVPFIQTDVAINPGNSGGPLFNMNGEVVGMNSQIYSRTGGYMGLSFAIPMNVVMNVVEQLKTKGKVARGWLGVQIQDVTRELAESFGMKRPHGALVAKVIPDSPAKAAGLKIGDIIVEFDGKEIEVSAALPPIVGMTALNKKAAMKVIRQGDEKSISVKIGLLPEQDDVRLAGNSAKPGVAKSNNRLGIMVTNPTGEQREQFQVLKNGVLVQGVNKGSAREAGIQRGDVILQIKNNVIRNVTDFDRIVKSLPAGKSVAVLIKRLRTPVFLAINIK
jgi:serine protease Do